MQRAITAIWKFYNILDAFIYYLRQPALRDAVVLDVGARGGVGRRWQLFRRFTAIRFVVAEADPVECQRLARQSNIVPLPYALGDQNRTMTLFETADPAASSLLEPNFDRISDLSRLSSCFDAGIYRVAREHEVVVSRYEDIDGAPEVDFVKVDVQGYDLHVLEGMGRRLESVICVMIEAHIIPIYRAQHDFCEIVRWLSGNGFQLIAIRSMGKDIRECNLHFERRMLDETQRRFATLWRKLYGISSASFRDSLSH